MPRLTDEQRQMRGMKAPFPYFGGKASIAPIIWQAFGDVPNLVEPFCGSAAILLARPDRHEWWNRTETVNDADGMISNFWRAVQAAPDDVAKWADYPVFEPDLHARHSWLVARKESLQGRIEGDPDYYDAKIAGWWLWGICIWIGSVWCGGKGPWRSENGLLIKTAGAGQGIWRQRPHLGGAGMGINRKLPHLEGAGIGNCKAWTEHLRDMMQRLSDRLRRVRVCCGDWSRVCGPTPTTKHGITGVFLDPPYSHAERDNALYRVEMETPSAVREWALERGDDPMYRIALCGYKDEHNMPGWTPYRWKARGGYAGLGDGSNDNATRETVWFSPHCRRLSEQAKMSMEVLCPD